MPNWCQNKIIIGSNSIPKLKRLVKEYQAGKLFAFVMPEPDYKKVMVLSTFPVISGKAIADPESAWWDWRNQNWGTKSDCGTDGGHTLDVKDGTLTLEVYTAWGPPTGIFAQLNTDGYTVEAYWAELGMMFCGSFKNGDEVNVEIKGAGSIPADIDKHLEISAELEEMEVEE